MSFFAVMFALLLEQLKPLPRDNWVHETLASWVRWTGQNFDAGQPHHTWVVWCVSVGVPVAVVAALYLLVAHFSLLLALAFDVALLYLTLGFRQFSHYYTDIRDALERGDEDEARRLLAGWRHLDASELPRTEVLRHVIEHALLAAHRHVFGVFFWFVVFSALGLGPVGAVLYRMAEFSSRYWSYRLRAMDAPANDALLALSRRLFNAMDHVPARLTAFGFAVVGNFEEAINGWRRD
ncbi:MAG TPA: regulatory signaling modulator protein AmpE, partial [Rubrivivax sp.]|nr:regulatory signaling modulator protein AmpE [Rubrivivax sp.]